MNQTVYVDLLFMINFSMDFLCFFLSSKILGRKLSLPRALAASAVGGLYSDISLFVNVGKMAALSIDILVCIIICAITFLKKGRLSSFPLYVLVYFAISFSLGGAMTAIFNLLNRSGLQPEAASGDGISVWTFALLALVSALITLFGGRFFRRRSTQKNADVEITYAGKAAKLRAMTDTGNFLREPITGKPCIVASVSSLSEILPDKILRAAKQNDLSAIEGLSPSDAKNIRIIPIKTAAGNSTLIALRTERITVDSGRGAEQIDALVALSNLEKTAQDSDVLLPPELLN